MRTKTVKVISGLLLAAVLAPSVFLALPQKAGAFWGIFDFGSSVDPVTGPAATTTAGTTGTSAGMETTQTGLKIKDVAKEIGRQMLMAVARKALQEVTKSTINWINSGFHGSPLFLENPDSFFRDIAKSEVRMLVDIFGYDILKFPFGRSWAIGVINMYKNQLAENASYSMSQALQDPVLQKNYINDFNTGGWNAFLVNTQYPENNPLGFQMKATEELARRVRGTRQTAVDKVNTTIAQGMGFLSPKMCDPKVNPDYNNGINEFRQPSFNTAEWERSNPYQPPTETGACATDPEGDLCQQQLMAYDQIYEGRRNGARTQWSFKNTCVKPDGTSGLVNTTPGSVVANQIMTATSSSFRQSELGAAVGNSLSAIFDALINKLLTDGLNSLASKVNPAPEDDNWSYGGLTLGSAEDSASTAWDSGPDEPVKLSEFKKKLNGYYIGSCAIPDGIPEENIPEERCKELKGTWTKNPAGSDYVPGDIANTQMELKFIYNDVPVRVDPATGLVQDGPGLYQMLAEIWPRARQLDLCLPGPDVAWETRIKDEVDRNTKKLQSLISGGSGGGDAQKAEAVQKELNFAVKFFQDWVYNKMISELPSSVIFLDAVKDVNTLAQQSNELEDAQRLKRQALARLQAIAKALESFTAEPSKGSAEERALISLWKQYKAALVDVSNTITIENMRNELSIAKDRFNSLNKLTKQCETERVASGWGVPGGRTSSWSGPVPPVDPEDEKMQKILGGLEPNAEQALFCNLPIATGYTHEMFTGPGTSNPPLPMVNAEKVMPYKVLTIKSALNSAFTSFGLSPKKTAYVNIQLSCNTIYKANILDYKGTLPGTTNITESQTDLPDDTGDSDLGVCTFPDEDEEETESFTDIIMTEEDCAANDGEWEPIAPNINNDRPDPEN